MESARAAVGRRSGNSSKGWPQSGSLTWNGSSWEPTRSEPLTGASGSSSSPRGSTWNTPRHSESYQSPERFVQVLAILQAQGKDMAMPLSTQAEMWPQTKWQTPPVMQAKWRRQFGKTERNEPLLPAQAELWPTATAGDPQRGKQPNIRETVNQGSNPSLGSAADRWPTPHANLTTGPGTSGREGGENIQTTVAKWPTATSKDETGRQYQVSGGKEYIALPGAAKDWPTPRATDGPNGGPNQRGSKGDGALPGISAHWPTVMSKDWKSGSVSKATLESNARPLNEIANQFPDGPDPSLQDRLTTLLGLTFCPPDLNWSQLSRRLNPCFVEWMMNFAEGWSSPDTDVPRGSADSAMQSVLLRLPSLSSSFGPDSGDD